MTELMSFSIKDLYRQLDFDTLEDLDNCAKAQAEVEIEACIEDCKNGRNKRSFIGKRGLETC